MKNSLIALALIIGLSSCIKEPTACINGPVTTTVFESTNFQSCSENAESVEWEVQNSSIGNSSYTSTSFNHSWDESGNYSVKLTSYSKGDKKTDRLSINVSVEDLCFECIKEGEYYWEGDYVYDGGLDEWVWDPYAYYHEEPEQRSTICTSDGEFDSEAEFLSYKSYFTSQGYQCTKK